MQDVTGYGLVGAETLEEAVGVIAARLANTDPAEGNHTETLNAYSADGRGAFVHTRDQLADGSVRSEQHLVEFQLRPDGQVAGRVFAMPTGYGTRQRCYRAPDPDAWTNQPCP